MDAIRVARGFTGREPIVKMFGSYHGHHDYVMVSIGVKDFGNIGPRDNYKSFSYGAGIPQSSIDLTVPVALQRRREHEQAHRAHGRRGPHTGRPHHGARHDEPRRRAARARVPRSRPRDHQEARHRPHLRRGQDRHLHRPRRRRRALGRRARHGHAWARRIAGGTPCGAIGGSDEVMDAIHQGTVFQVGTYAGNPLSMAAARASFEQVMTDDAYAHLNYLNDRLVSECDAHLRQVRLPRLHGRHLVQGLRQLRLRQDHRLRVVHQVPGPRARRPGLAVQLQPRRHHRPRSRRGVDAVHPAHRRGHRPLRQRLRGAHPRRDRLTHEPAEAPPRRPCGRRAGLLSFRAGRGPATTSASRRPAAARRRSRRRLSPARRRHAARRLPAAARGSPRAPRRRPSRTRCRRGRAPAASRRPVVRRAALRPAGAVRGRRLDRQRSLARVGGRCGRRGVLRGRRCGGRLPGRRDGCGRRRRPHRLIERRLRRFADPRDLVPHAVAVGAQLGAGARRERLIDRRQQHARLAELAEDGDDGDLFEVARRRPLRSPCAGRRSGPARGTRRAHGDRRDAAASRSRGCG